MDLLNCISYDGRYLSYQEQRWQCPRCLSVVRAPAVRTYQPSTICGCEASSGIRHQMNDLGLAPPVGYRLRQPGE